MKTRNKKQRLFYLTDAEDQLYWELYSHMRTKYGMKNFTRMITYALEQLYIKELDSKNDIKNNITIEKKLSWLSSYYGELYDLTTKSY